MAKDEKKLLEVDLCKPVSDFLTEQGYMVRSEVKHCDIVAIKDEELVIVELKRNLSVDLLVQAAKRQKSADIVYIAIPKPKKLMGNAKWQDLCHLIQRLELGLLLVSFKGCRGMVEVAIHPLPFDRARSMRSSIKSRAAIIKEAKSRFVDANTGGSTRTKLVTAYREDAIFIACCLNKYGPLSPKKLRELGTNDKKTTTILSKDFYGWFDRVKNGVYEINSAGKAALEQYAQLAGYYYSKLEQKTE